MKPEEIDKLFKERLEDSTPTPPADMWARLQQRMQENEAPAAPAVVSPAASETGKGKQRFLWLYSSVAATVSLLLTVGVVFYNINTGTPEISESLAQRQHTVQPQEQPTLTLPELTTAPALAQQTDENPVVAQPEEKKSDTQATEHQASASTLTKQPSKQQTLTNARPKAQASKAAPDAQKVIAGRSIPEVSPVSPEPAVPANTVSFAANAKPATTADLNAEPVEIVIKRSFSAKAQESERELEQVGSKKVALAKNIFKQVRNLAAGEGMELSELGLNADRLNVETQIGKQKLSKSIKL